MATNVHYTIINGAAARRVADPGLAQWAERLKNEVAARTPRGATGNLASGWYVARVPARGGFPRAVPAVRLIRNDVPYARSVEFGSRRGHRARTHVPAAAMMGRTLAQYSQWQRK